jgi:dolichol-phosphate mannosyltransferase
MLITAVATWEVLYQVGVWFYHDFFGATLWNFIIVMFLQLLWILPCAIIMGVLASRYKLKLRVTPVTVGSLVVMITATVIWFANGMHVPLYWDGPNGPFVSLANPEMIMVSRASQGFWYLTLVGLVGPITWQHINKILQARFIRFAAVGGTGALLGLGILYGLTDGLGLYYVISYIVSFIVSLTSNYIWNTLWTFRMRMSAKAYFEYAGTSLITFGITTGITVGLTEVGTWYMLSAVVATLCGFVTNFVLSKSIVWRSNNEGSRSWYGRFLGQPRSRALPK